MTGVSLSKVSRVLSCKGKIGDSTRKKVLAAIDEFMFTPGVVMQKFEGLPKKIALLIPESGEYYRDDPSSSADIRALLNESKKSNDDIVILKIGKNESEENELINKLLIDNYDGVIISDPFVDNTIIEKIVQNNIPYVITNGIFPQFQYNYIDFDNINGLFQITDYLISRGHVKIAILAGPQNHSVTQNRMDGVVKAFQKNNIELPENILYGSFNLDDGYKNAKILLERKCDFTAILGFSDLISLGAMKAVKESGLRIPEDISIIGVDNIEYSKYSDPPLTTVDRNVDELAEILVKYLYDLTYNKGKIHSFNVFLKMNLVERESCRKIS